MSPSQVPSIHRRVLVWVLAALAIGASLMVVTAYVAITHEISEVFEDNLKQVALAVATHHDVYGLSHAPRLVGQLPKIYEEYGGIDFVTSVWSLDGTLMHTSNAAVSLPFLSRSGSSVVSIGHEQWHLYTIVLEDGIVQAAQQDSARRFLANESSSRLIWPALLMLAVLTVLLTLALQRGLAPLSLAADEVTARSVESLHPIGLSSQPRELHALVGAVNDLMARLGSALALQRHFLADAAHELRTPITALKLQLQLLERASDAPTRQAATGELRAGIDRAQHLIEQLLQLSRLAPETPALRRDTVDLAALVRSTVSNFSARADERQIDLGAVTTEPVLIAADAQQLTILLNNLIDNALRHTPPGGQIDVEATVQEGSPRLSVSDSGPGIPEADRQRVFDRFYRGQPAEPASSVTNAGEGSSSDGSGLGLAIVRAVAERHGAGITLGDEPRGGLRVSLTFPASGVLS